MTIQIDHRPAQSAVRDQGARPLCAAFAVSAAHEWIGAATARSVEHVHWSAKARDGIAGEATQLPCVLDAVLDGQAPEEAWPFNNPAWPGGPPAAVAGAEQLQAASGHARIDPSSFDDLAGRMTGGGVVLLSVGVKPKAWRAAAADGWILDGPGPVASYHAVLAVGLTSATATRPRALIVKNSWGPDWGDDGYGYLSEPYWDAYQRYAFELGGN